MQQGPGYSQINWKQKLEMAHGRAKLEHNKVEIMKL